MSKTGFEWVIPPRKAFVELALWQQAAIRAEVKNILLRYQPQIETWMKANGPWQDRTGNARQALNAFIDELADSITLDFGHKVIYGKYLEFKNQGRYQVVAPALDHFAPQIFADIKRALS